MADSMAEAEYISWTCIWYNNQSTGFMAENPVFHVRTKHSNKTIS